MVRKNNKSPQRRLPAQQQSSESSSQPETSSQNRSQQSNSETPPAAQKSRQGRPAKNVKPTASRKGSRKQAAPVMREITRLQQSVKLIIPVAPFCRVIKEIMHNTSRDIQRITPEALSALRESSEAYLTGVFGDANKITLNRKQVTLHPRDVQLLIYLRGL